MTYEANQKYNVVISKAGLVESSQGTLGIELLLVSDTHGEIFHTMWVSAKTKERQAEVLREFGITDEQIAGPFWAENCQALVGRPAEIELKSEEYNGETRVRVAWIHGKDRKPKGPKPASHKTIAAAQRLFGSAPDEELGF